MFWRFCLNVARLKTMKNESFDTSSLEYEEGERFFTVKKNFEK
jgi:hypothetical protein